MQPNLATTFAALGDPTRLAILQRLLAEGERTVGEIAKDCPMSLPAVSRHIQVLEKAGLRLSQLLVEVEFGGSGGCAGRARKPWKWSPTGWRSSALSGPLLSTALTKC